MTQIILITLELTVLRFSFEIMMLRFGHCGSQSQINGIRLLPWDVDFFVKFFVFCLQIGSYFSVWIILIKLPFVCIQMYRPISSNLLISQSRFGSDVPT